MSEYILLLRLRFAQPNLIRDYENTPSEGRVLISGASLVLLVLRDTRVRVSFTRAFTLSLSKLVHF